MTEADNSKLPPEAEIIIVRNGPYRVVGGVPLRKLTQVCTEFGEPVEWQDQGPVETPPGRYLLCRCGVSKSKPFCDGSHTSTNFIGTETAVTDRTSGRIVEYTGDSNLIVRKQVNLCMASGFCYLKDTSVDELTRKAKDPVKQARAIKMVEDCPSGSLMYRFEPAGADVEPDLPVQIAETIEITSYGPIEGPLWVMGYIPITRSDGVPFIARNRVTLCRCGSSANKPLCDGTHRFLQERKLRLSQKFGK